jgi:hypothetical protein
MVDLSGIEPQGGRSVLTGRGRRAAALLYKVPVSGSIPNKKALRGGLKWWT